MFPEIVHKLHEKQHELKLCEFEGNKFEIFENLTKLALKSQKSKNLISDYFEVLFLI